MTFYFLGECDRLVSLCGRFSRWPFSFALVLVVAVLDVTRYENRTVASAACCYGRVLLLPA